MLITLGCDPEFIVLKNGSSSSASNYFCDHGEGAINSRGFALKCDGQNYLGEIETKYSKRPEKIVKYIENALLDIRDNHGVDFYGGSYYNGYGIGGHIHFGIRIQDRSKMMNYMNLTLGHASYIAGGRNMWNRVIRTGYGRYGQSEGKSYGFEYRTPPSWLISREWTKFFFALAYLTGNAYNKDKALVMDYTRQMTNLFNTKKQKFRMMMVFLNEHFSEYWRGDELSPIFRIMKNKQTWNDKPEGCLKRWGL